MKADLIFLICMVMVAIISIGAVSADENIPSDNNGTSLDVETPLNDTQQVDLSPKTFENLQTTIDEAEDNESITISGEYVSTGNPIMINKSVSIFSQDRAVLNANHTGRIFEITAGNVTLNNLTIINSKEGAIYSTADNLICRECKFTGNNGKGVVIYSVGNTTIESCKFTNNNAVEGVIEITHNWENNIKREIALIKNCSFAGNSKKGCVIISDISDTGDSYEDSHYFGNLIVEDSTFSNNGDVISAYNSVKVKNCSFTKNNEVISVYTEDSFEITNCTMTGNVAEYGVIDIKTGYGKITKCTFKNNKNALIVNWDALPLTINGKKYNDFASLDNSLKNINLLSVSVPAKPTAVFKSAKTLNIKLINRFTKKPVEEYVIIKIYTGKNYKTYERWTNSKGITKLKLSSLSEGNHKLEIKCAGGTLKFAKKSVTLKILKPTSIKAPKVKNKYKRNAYFKVTVKYKKIRGKSVKLISLKKTYVKIKIGKKTYKVKTNKKGIAKFNTKKLKIGKHKVTITSGNSNYYMNAKSTITIRK